MRFAALLLCTSLALGLAPRAAEAADPIGVWLEAAVRAEPVDDLRITVSNQVRFSDSLARLGRVLPEVSLAYRLNSWLRLDGGYRFTADKRSEGDFRYLHRVFADVRMRWEALRDLQLGYRSRLQTETTRDRRDRRQNQPEWRNRVSATLAMHDVVQPRLSWELFAPFSNGGTLRAAEWRLKLGLGLDLGAHTVEPFYHYQRDIEVDPGQGEHVLGLGYRFDL